MADQQTGGMVALIPRAQDATALAVRGGDKPDQLHLTLTYLGDDISQMSTADRAAAVASAAQAAAGIGPVTANAMGHAVFNPSPVTDSDRQPCAVYLISDSAVLGPLRNALAGHASAVQHEPFIPHVTAGFGVPVSRLSYSGPVIFDTLRIALADQVLDFPLGDSAAIKALVERGPRPLVLRGDEYGEMKMFRFVALEGKVTSENPNAVKLRQWWAHEGMKLWGGKFTRLVKELRKHTPIKDPRVLKGLAANIYHLALGKWPGRHDRKYAFDWVDLEFSQTKASDGQELDGNILMEQYKAMRAQLDEVLDPDDEGDADVPEEDPGDVASADESTDGEGMEVSPEEAYADGLASDIDWQVEGDGTLDDPDSDDELDDDGLDENFGSVDESEEEGDDLNAPDVEDDSENLDESDDSDDLKIEEDPEADQVALDELADLMETTEPENDTPDKTHDDDEEAA
jgi:hypothetical protein